MKFNIIFASTGLLVVTVGLITANFVMPDSFLFPLKRWEEKIVLNFDQNPRDEISYNLHLLNRRLSEVSYIASKKEYPLFYPTSLRFASLAGDITNISLANGKVEKSTILQEFKKDSSTIQKILSQKNATEEWKYICDDNNYLSIYSSKLQ